MHIHFCHEFYRFSLVNSVNDRRKVSAHANLRGFGNLDPNFIGSAQRDKEGVEINLLHLEKKGKDIKDGRNHNDLKKSKPNNPSEKPLFIHKDAEFSSQTLTIQSTRKGRGGKTVTVISGLVLTEKSMESLTKKLKAMLGTGGTVQGNTIEIQGKQADKLLDILRNMGFKVKRSGG